MNVKMNIVGTHSGKPYAPGDIISVSEKEGEMLVSRGLGEYEHDAYELPRYDAPEDDRPQTRRGRPPRVGDANAGSIGS